MAHSESTTLDRPAVTWSLLIVRIVVGGIFVVHGSQLLLGAFGGPGLAGTVSHMGQIGYLVAIGQFFGGLGLLVGVLPRFSAAALIVIMLGAIYQVHMKNGFFNQQGGYEFNLALIGLLLSILIAGPGAYSFSERVHLHELFGRSGPRPSAQAQ